MGVDPEEFMLTATLHVLKVSFLIVFIRWIAEIGAGMTESSMGKIVGVLLIFSFTKWGSFPFLGFC